MKNRGRIGKVSTLRGVADPYSRRILSNLIGKDPMLVYRRTPAQLRKLTHRLSTGELRKQTGKGKWSIGHLISHFCDAEWAMGFRIRKAIAEPGSPLPAYDEKKWAASLHYEESDVKRKLDLFTELRNSHVDLIGFLSDREIRRYGIHAERGKETIERMVHMLAGHDVNHLKQIERIRAELKRP